MINLKQELGLEAFETSAFSGLDVDSVFNCLVYQVVAPAFQQLGLLDENGYATNQEQDGAAGEARKHGNRVTWTTHQS